MHSLITTFNLSVRCVERKVHSIKVIAFEKKMLSPALQMKKCLISRFLKLIIDAICCSDVAMNETEGAKFCFSPQRLRSAATCWCLQESLQISTGQKNRLNVENPRMRVT